MARGLTLLPFILLCFLPSQALSGESSGFSFGVGGGAYRPREYTNNTVIRDNFGTDGTFMGRLELGWVIHRLVSLEASAGYFQATNTFTETAIASNGEPFTRSADYTIHVVPLDLSIVFKADFFEGQVVIPYLGIGVDEYYFNQQGKDGLWGGKWGSHGLGGLRLFMNPIDPKHTGNLKADYGIDAVYLDLQGKYAVAYRHLGGSTEGFDFSGWLFTASFLFEF